MCHHTRLIFVFFVETGFHHVGQVGLELPTSSDLATSASQSAEITGISHHAQPKIDFKNKLDCVLGEFTFLMILILFFFQHIDVFLLKW